MKIFKLCNEKSLDFENSKEYSSISVAVPKKLLKCRLYYASGIMKSKYFNHYFDSTIFYWNILFIEFLFKYLNYILKTVFVKKQFSRKLLCSFIIFILYDITVMNNKLKNILTPYSTSPGNYTFVVRV